jgi:hypothetical protein
MYELGLFYKEGLGINKDIEKAAELFEKAASFPPKIMTPIKELNNRGVFESMIELFYIYLLGF